MDGRSNARQVSFRFALICGIAFVAGMFASEGFREQTVANAEITKTTPRRAFQSGATLSFEVLKNIDSTLKKIDKRLAKIERSVTAK